METLQFRAFSSDFLIGNAEFVVALLQNDKEFVKAMKFNGEGFQEVGWYQTMKST
jgi:hypothetical protein